MEYQLLSELNDSMYLILNWPKLIKEIYHVSQPLPSLVLSSRSARCLKMPRQLVNRGELGKLIAQTSGAILMINESNYRVRSKSGLNTYTVTASQSEWICSCPDYARHNTKCKHVYAVEFYQRQNAAFLVLLYPIDYKLIALTCYFIYYFDQIFVLNRYLNKLILL